LPNVLDLELNGRDPEWNVVPEDNGGEEVRG
jgi:hypothetical protein